MLETCSWANINDRIVRGKSEAEVVTGVGAKGDNPRFPHREVPVLAQPGGIRGRRWHIGHNFKPVGTNSNT